MSAMEKADRKPVGPESRHSAILARAGSCLSGASKLRFKSSSNVGAKRAWWPAVGAPFKRVVRPQLAASAMHRALPPRLRASACFATSVLPLPEVGSDDVAVAVLLLPELQLPLR